MAITIEQQPTSFEPVYNDLIYLASSDNTGESNFSIVFDVYIDSNLTARHKIPVRPGTSQSVFNASSSIVDSITHDIDIDTDNFTANTNSYKKIQVKVGEEYDVAGVKTVFADLTNGNEIYVFNSALKRNDWIDYSSGTFLLVDSTDRFLTNAPSIQEIEVNQHAWLHLINDDPTTVTSLQVKEYDSTGSLLATHSLTNSLTTDNDDNRFLRVGVGHQNLTDSIVAFPDASLDYYTVQVLNVATPISELFTYQIVDECKYSVRRLHFLNRLGGFDSFNFSKVSSDSLNVSRETFNKSQGTLSGTSFTSAKTDRYKNVSRVDYDERVTAFSRRLTDAEYVWLAELITSPIVFEEVSGELIPINITNSNYTKLKRVNGEKDPLTINYEYTDLETTQRY